MDEKKIELKPCPFCGSKAEIQSLSNYHKEGYCYFATCLMCGAEMPRTAKNIQQAVELWNRRSTNEN